MMKYPKEYLNEIKLRLKVSQVVGKTVKLKKEERSILVCLHSQMKKFLRLLSMMKKVFIIVLAQQNMETSLILL